MREQCDNPDAKENVELLTKINLDCIYILSQSVDKLFFLLLRYSSHQSTKSCPSSSWSVTSSSFFKDCFIVSYSIYSLTHYRRLLPLLLSSDLLIFYVNGHFSALLARGISHFHLKVLFSFGFCDTSFS